MSMCMHMHMETRRMWYDHDQCALLIVSGGEDGRVNDLDAEIGQIRLHP